MHRFFCKEKIKVGEHTVLKDQQAHQISRVLRMQPGDDIVLFDGIGDDFLCEIKEIDKHSIIVEAKNSFPGEAERDHVIHLFQAIPNKWSKFEDILKKGTELGVKSFHPTKMSRCETKLKDKGELPKEERLHHIVIEACEQSGGSLLPPITNAIDFERACKEAPGLKIMAYEGKSTHDLPYIDLTGEISLFIGPEGGITEEEAKIFEENGGYTFNLGKRILRTETAPIAILGAILFG